jgi:hypothetical protein
MSDDFLRPTLMQPKKEIGDYIEGEGILVPKRFKSLLAAKRSGQPFIIRSEHPQDYAGISGWLDSIIVNKDRVTRSQRTLRRDHYMYGYDSKDFLKEIGTAISGSVSQRTLEALLKRSEEKRISEFAKVTYQDPSDIEDDISYSYWEHLSKGNNIQVVQDKAIPQTYHILAFRSTPSTVASYGRYNSEKEDFDFEHMPITPALKKSMPEIIKTYHKVSGLKKFDYKTNPLLELQVINGRVYFLQYHVGSKSQDPKFRLDRSPYKGEIEADLVIGATKPEGETVNVIWNREQDYIFPEREACAKEQAHNHGTIREEIMKPRTDIMLLPISTSFSFYCLKIGVGHDQASSLFMPKVSVIFNQKKIDLTKFKHYDRYRTDSFPAHIISDGNKAFIRQLE